MKPDVSCCSTFNKCSCVCVCVCVCVLMWGNVIVVNTNFSSLFNKFCFSQFFVLCDSLFFEEQSICVKEFRWKIETSMSMDKMVFDNTLQLLLCTALRFQTLSTFTPEHSRAEEQPLRCVCNRKCRISSSFYLNGSLTLTRIYNVYVRLPGLREN